MATEIKIKKSDILFAINFGSRATDDATKTSFYHFHDWFKVREDSDDVLIFTRENLPSWVKDFAKTPQENKKDSKIKELEEIRDKCMEVIVKLKWLLDPITNTNKFKEVQELHQLLNSYKDKYADKIS